MDTSDNLLDFASKHLVGVQRSGPENVMAICPFHVKRDGQAERTPSFAFCIVNGLWLCHSCKERGSFRTLLRALASPQTLRVYTPLLVELDCQVAHRGTRRRVFVDLGVPPFEESVLGLFEGCPLSLLDEGFEEETLQRFEVGYDERNQRVTFPLRDMVGRLVGFSGRAVGDVLPRYKVYDKAEYEAWGLAPRKVHKGLLLWNFHKMYPAAFFEESPKSVLVEGFKACMWVHQAGFPNVVAMLGSSLSTQQKMLLERIGGTIYIFTDNDEAGQIARKQTATTLGKSCRVKVVEYETRQPTDLSPEAVAQALESATDVGKWLLRGTSWHSEKTRVSSTR